MPCATFSVLIITGDVAAMNAVLTSDGRRAAQVMYSEGTGRDSALAAGVTWSHTVGGHQLKVLLPAAATTTP